MSQKMVQTFNFYILFLDKEKLREKTYLDSDE